MSNYRSTRNYENLERRIFTGVGEFDIPNLFPETINEKCEFIDFNQAISCKCAEGKCVHFFIDDYRFNRLWTNIDRYIEKLMRFSYVMTPDFSTYTDFPKAIQIYNHYRKHWVGAYLQERGVKIIPTISWSTPDSFEWCFDGEPVGGTVAVSSVGCMNGAKKGGNVCDGIQGDDRETVSTKHYFLRRHTGRMQGKYRENKTILGEI